MRIGVVLRNSGPQGVDAVRRVTDLAADLGYASVWASDHVVAPPDFTERYDREWLDPFVSLAVAAERAPVLQIGLSVLVVPYRPALPTARVLASLQDLSGGRLTVGVGSGWLESEFAALGESFAERGETTEARLAAIRSALVGEHPDFSAPTAAVPLLAAGNGPRILRRAKVLDGWHPIALTPTAVAAGAAHLPPGHRIAVRTRLGWGRERRDRPLFGTPAEIAEDLTAYAAAGVTDLVVDHAAATLDEMEPALRDLAGLIGRQR